MTPQAWMWLDKHSDAVIAALSGVVGTTIGAWVGARISYRLTSAGKLRLIHREAHMDLKRPIDKQINTNPVLFLTIFNERRTATALCHPTVKLVRKRLGLTVSSRLLSKAVLNEDEIFALRARRHTRFRIDRRMNEDQYKFAERATHFFVSATEPTGKRFRLFIKIQPEKMKDGRLSDDGHNYPLSAIGN